MGVDVDKVWEGTPTGPPAVVRMLDQFRASVVEFCDSLIVVATSHPAGPRETTQRVVVASGNAYARDGLVEAYLDGQAPDGAWYAVPGGLLAHLGSPLPWDDAVSASFWDLCEALEETMAPYVSGMVILATCGEGPSGSTKVVVRASGNSISATNAMAQWRAELTKDSEQ